MNDVNERETAARTLNDAISAGRRDVVESLIADGVSVDAADAIKQTPMVTAVRSGHADVVRLLSQHGADIEKPAGFDGRRPLLVAVSSGHLDVVRLLIELGADVNAVDSHGLSALWQASFKLINEAINVPDRRQWTRAQDRIPTGNAAIVELLIHEGADVNLTGSGVQTPAVFIRETGIPRLTALLQGREAIRSLWSRLGGWG